MWVYVVLLAVTATPTPDHRISPGNVAQHGTRHHHRSSHQHGSFRRFRRGHSPQLHIDPHAHADARSHAQGISRQLHAQALHGRRAGTSDGRYLGVRHFGETVDHHAVSRPRPHTHDHYFHAYIAPKKIRARDVHPRHVYHNPEARASTKMQRAYDPRRAHHNKAQHTHERANSSEHAAHLRDAHHQKTQHTYTDTPTTVHDPHLRHSHHHKAKHALAHANPPAQRIHLHHARSGPRSGAKCACISNGLPAESGLKLDAPNTDSNANYDYIEVKRATNAAEHVVYYPSTYGSYCDTWERFLDGNCTRRYPPAYCSQKWCFVGVECDAPDVKKSLFFPTTSLRYSYRTCGGYNPFTAFECHSKNEDECDTKQCTWSEDDAVCQIAQCQCTGSNDNIDSNAGAPVSSFDTQPDDYGTSCDSWDAARCRRSEGLPTLGLWCCKRWCYVKKNCPSARPSTAVKGLYYSYLSCPDDADELLGCPWKAPIDFHGRALPLSPSASQALDEYKPVDEDKQVPSPKDHGAQTAAIIAVVVTLILIASILYAARYW